MGSKAIPALVPAAAFPRIGADDHALGMVQLLRAFSDCVAIIRFWAASDLGAVSLSRNGAAYYFVAHVIAPSSRISAIGISCGCRLRRNWWRNSLVWRATIISAAGDADGTVHLPEHSIFYGAVFFLAIVVFAGISSRWTEDPDREWWGRAAGWLFAVALGWLLISGLVIFGPLSLKWTWSFITTGGVAALVTVLGGRSPRVAANEKDHATASPMGLILSKASTIAAVVFSAVLLILITEMSTSVIAKLIETYHVKLSYQADLNSKSGLLGRAEEYLNVIFYTPLWLVLPLALLLLLLGVVMARLVNANKFSLHGVYRDRLIRAYLGASNSDRKPNPFTGFDENDNIKMRDLWVREKFHSKLMPVVNIALNLVSGEKLGWQERKAQSFTVTPLHCGSSAMDPGYRSTSGE